MADPNKLGPKMKGGMRPPFLPPPVKINQDKKTMAIGLLVLVFSLSLLVVFKVYSNAEIMIYDQSCPALNGRVHKWGVNMCTVAILHGLVGLMMSGLVSNVLLNMGMREEAICFGSIFMGICGKLIRIILWFVAISMNVYGSFLISEADQNGMQSEKKFPRVLAETYCHSAIIGLVKFINYFVYIIVVAYSVFLIRKAYLSCKYESNRTTNKFGPEEENISKVLGIPTAEEIKQLKSKEEPKKGQKVPIQKKKNKDNKSYLVLFFDVCDSFSQNFGKTLDYFPVLFQPTLVPVLLAVDSFVVQFNGHCGVPVGLSVERHPFSVPIVPGGTRITHVAYVLLFGLIGILFRAQ